MSCHITSAAICAALLLLAGPATAHVTFERAEAVQNASYKGTLRVPHGCAGQSTHTVRITIPEGVINVKPMPKAGWKLETRTGSYGQSYELSGRKIAEGVREVIWSGGDLPDAHFDEFVITARMTDALKPGPVYFPVVQQCATAQNSWSEIPSPGQDAHGLKSPAPAVMIMAQASAGHGAGQANAGSSVKVGNLEIVAPWTRATPAGAKVAGGFMTITNTGTTPDRLVGGSFPLAGRFEVHEMAVTNGVMTMRELAKGLEIAPGAKIEFKPGGFHVMFLDLAGQVREGQLIKGTLVFEKAGTVEVEYRVAPIGARALAGAHVH